MIELAVLYMLGLLHACLAGYRDAAGRNHLISKARYFRRATLRGFHVAGTSGNRTIKTNDAVRRSSLRDDSFGRDGETTLFPPGRKSNDCQSDAEDTDDWSDNLHGINSHWPLMTRSGPAVAFLEFTLRIKKVCH